MATAGEVSIEDGGKETAVTVSEPKPEPASKEREDKDDKKGSEAKPKDSGIKKRRIKINLPGIYTTDDSSKKPPEYRWAQQKLPACRPVYTGLNLFFLFVIIGILFVALGAVFLAFNLQLKEYTVSYTDCAGSFPNETEAAAMNCTLPPVPHENCSSYIANLSQFGRDERIGLAPCPCYCQVTLNVEEDMSPPVHVYYQLGNYYQNHRRYVNSWSPRSLRANDISKSRSDCNPFADNGRGGTYFPCGIIANSFFNDTLAVRGYTINSSEIAWKTDRDSRYRNPPAETNPYETDRINTGGTILPPNWLTLIDHGQRNESFMVWFRVAAFPIFRKLYGRITPPNDEPLRAGNYTIDVVYNYPVNEFDGTKTFVLAEVSRMGSRNLFLGIAYIVTGALSVALGVIILIVHMTCSRWKLKHEDFLKRDW